MSNTLDIVNLIANKNKAEALDAVHDLMQNSAAEAIGMYKQTVASTYYNEPVESLETEQ
jgi:DNA-binding XRE family transcriptional regulator